MSAIEIERVSQRFPGVARPAVDECTLTVKSGDLTVVLGPSGSGKTTLLKLINRLYEPDSGRILVAGTDVRFLPAPALRRRIGYVIQQIGLFLGNGGHSVGRLTLEDIRRAVLASRTAAPS
ncbi:MAG: ATP-binding cassette domain-containing protein [bacterium]